MGVIKDKFFNKNKQTNGLIPAQDESIDEPLPNKINDNKLITDAEKKKCHAIIHSHAVAAGAGNLIPVPGTGLAADMVTMTTMAMALASVFGGSITESIAKNMAINSIVAAMKKQPVKVITKEVSKIFPVLGQIIAPTISVTMIESAGWILVEALANERAERKNGGKI